MSASTVPITANPAVNNNPSLALGSRRRTVSVTEKRSSNIEMVAEGGGVSEPAGGGEGRDLSHSIRGEMVLEKPKDLSAKKGLINSTISPRRRKVVSKPPEKPLWQTLLSIFTKNFLLLLVLLGLIQMIRKLALNSGSGSPMEISEFEGRIAEVESFLKTTTKMMQVQVEVVDKKIENEVGGLRRELAKIEERGVLFQNELKKLEAETEGLDKSLGELRAGGFLTKEDLRRFLDEFNQARDPGPTPEETERYWSLDKIRAVAREIVEKEIERHAADGLGWVDYALASGGAIVVGHSEPYFSAKGSWFSKGQKTVNSDATRMLQPSFGEPGQCFPLKGSKGFVEIRLRTAIIPEAVTLEHVTKSVAYDRSSAPKDCRISGWFRGHDANPSSQAEKFLLAEFTYDLEKSNAQTFNAKVTDSGIVNMVRLDFTSNHGGPHTCIYRLRVHGHEPDSVAVSTLRP